MSSFLSNFQSGDYEKNIAKKESPDSVDEKETEVGKQMEASESKEQEPPEVSSELPQRVTRSQPVAEVPSRHSQEETEHDPTFQKRQRKKWLLLSLLGVIIVTVGGVTVYQMTHVEMPDFQGKSISDVQKWAAQNKLTVVTKPEYSLEKEANHVLKQAATKGKKIRKGQELAFTVSQGADPEEKVILPDFNQLTHTAAEEWVAKNKTDNLKLVSEYNGDVEKGKLLRMELKGDATKENFKRKDSGTLYYSKGKEVYQKNISVPDFSGKMKSDVETWAKTNSIEMTYKDVPSQDQEVGKVTKQSIVAKEKVAKQTKMEVEISAGKPITVPDFGTLTPEEAAAQKNLQVTVKHQYSNEASYGQLLWQTLDAGSVLTEKDDLAMTVTYSEGRPYLKDVTGETEGALQKIFYDEYHSKGANINYTIKYVNSEEKKGTVVSMSAYNVYVPLDYTVEIRISNGN